MNPIYNQLNGQNNNQLMNSLNQLKQQFKGDPNQYIQQLLNSGKVSQAQYNQAVQTANRLMGMFK